MNPSHPSTAQTTDNQKLKTMMDYLSISFIHFSMDFTLLDANESFFKMTGASREELTGRNMLTIISGEEAKAVDALFASTFEKGEDFVQYEFYVYSREQKRKIPCLFHASANRDYHGHVISVNVLLMDLTSQKKIQTELEKEKKTLEAVLFGIRDYVSVFDIKGKYVFGSPNSANIHTEKKQPLLPLESTGPVDLTLTVNRQKRTFRGEVRAIKDTRGELFAFAETLTDITSNIMLKEKEQELFQIRQQLKTDQLRNEMVGSSKAMESVFHTILRCAEVDSSVLITGETGVGKEVAARAIHNQSRRKNKHFVAVNCGALPENLMESELFGHIKGAFTGAIHNRQGLFREAHGGTLFLDEIGDLNRPLQVKLLRALQEREVRPVGGDQSYRVDVRIISATNLDLKALVNQNSFRHDLYYRIAVIPLLIPPLRDRPDDILQLTEHFIQKYQKNNRQRPKRINATTAKALCNYDWPGNIRELENAVEHALAMVQGPVITPECIPVLNSESPTPESGVAEPFSEGPFRINKAQQQNSERIAIIDALKQYNGNQTHAARELGISRVTLWRKKTMYGID